MENMKTTSPHIDYIRRVWVTAVLLCCLLLVAAVSAAEESAEESDTTPELSAASDAHNAISNYTGAENCLVCHRQAGRDFIDSIHYTWQGNATNVVGKEGKMTGKRVGDVTFLAAAVASIEGSGPVAVFL